MSTKPSILTRADDLGSYRSANRAIMEACTRGIARNTSIMVPASYFDEAAAMFAPEKNCCIGLHATLTCEWDNARWRPVLPPEKVPSIVDADGFLHSSVDAINAAGVNFEQMIDELQAQLAMARRRGLGIRYVDTHMSFGWLFEGGNDSRRFCHVMMEWAEREGLAYHGWGSELPLKELPRGRRDEVDPIRALAEAIHTLEPGTYSLVAHPAYNDEEMRQAGHKGQAPGMVARERDTQRRMFTDPQVIEACEARGVELITYADLRGA